MHFNRINRLFAATALLASACNAVPVELPGAPDVKALAPRATYKVVNIDGGPTPGRPSGPVSPPGSGNAVTMITVVATTATAQDLNTATGIPIVDIEDRPKTTTVFVQPPVQTTPATTSISATTSSSSTSAPKASTTPPTFRTSQASRTSTSPTAAPPTPTSGKTSATPTSTSTTVASEITTLPPSTSSAYATATTQTSSTFDDGMWHTSYPPWNGTRLVRRASRPRLW